jgi:hypothetical protein
MNMSDSRTSPAPATEAQAAADLGPEILGAIARIQYGSVEVTVHDGRVVQIECREKIRLGAPEGARRSPVRPIR